MNLPKILIPQFEMIKAKDRINNSPRLQMSEQRSKYTYSQIYVFSKALLILGYAIRVQMGPILASEFLFWIVIAIYEDLYFVAYQSAQIVITMILG